MLNYIFELMQEYNVPGWRLFGYTSFRALITIVLALLISSIFGEYFIRYFKKKQISETLRDLDKTNLKVGVPTMGGLIIIVSILVPCLLIGRLSNVYMLLLIITTVWLGIVGFADDYIKTFKKNKDGIPGKVKVVSQVGLGLLIGLTLYLSPQAVMRENITVTNSANITEVQHEQKAEKLTKTTIPFVKSHNLDYSEIMSFCGKHAHAAGWVLFVIVTIFIVTAVSNGANLNDGMDGMLAGNAAIIGVTLGILAYVSSHVNMAEYLNIMFLPGSEEVVIFVCAFVGALVVQRIPRTGVHGRHRQPHHRRHNCRNRHTAAQGDTAGVTLRNIRCREPFGNIAGCILQAGQEEGHTPENIQVHPPAPPLHHQRREARQGEHIPYKKTAQAHARGKSDNTLLDCDHSACSNNYNDPQGKIIHIWKRE